jgi:hypothetical protein
MQSARDLNDRRVVKVPGKTLRVDRCRGDDQLQVAALGQELLKVAEEEVDVQAALVRLVDDQRVVLFEPDVALRLGEQDAVGHQLDQGIGSGAVAEADLVANQPSHLALQLLRDTCRCRPCGDPARLCVTNQAGGAATDVQADLGDLRGLARAGFAADDQYLMLGNQLRDLGTPPIDRQVVGEDRLWQACPPRSHGGA